MKPKPRLSTQNPRFPPLSRTEGHPAGLLVKRRNGETEKRRRPDSPAPGWVEVTVSDTGPGIPEDVRPHIFEPFYTTKVSGTGLGLAIVKRDIERMGGTIEAGIQDGQGAVFIIRLPGGDHER
ncbi:MAG: HAMP domain-containing histidine kinase [Candidatus Latescibacteria bacterium]|nr:HAMP domain-containing histidine kinase [Candidatus Latescibacterota bacterium]